MGGGGGGGCCVSTMTKTFSPFEIELCNIVVLTIEKMEVTNRKMIVIYDT